MLRTVHLYGSLGRKFGRQHRIDVESPAEAIRALSNLHPKFRKALQRGRYEVRIGDVPLDEGALDLSMGKSADLHITPAAQVAGIETILIVGLGLIAAAAIAVTFLMQPKVPDPGSRERDTKDDSWIFDGPVNVTEQGHPVPVVYGKMRVGSVVGSAGLDTTDAALTDGQANPGPGGKGGARHSTPGIRGTSSEVWENNVNLAKGGKGGGGEARAAQEDPNTLQSQATARILDLIAEGEIGGLVDGLKSVYFDETPVQNSDDSYNFSGLTLDSRVGLPEQEPLPNFAAAENSYETNVEVTKDGGPVTRRLLNDDADRCRVTIGLPRLFKQDTENGDLKSHAVTIRILHQSNGGGFTQIVRHEFRGKCTSLYQRSFDVLLDGPGPHDIRVERISPDAELASIEDKTFLDVLTEIVDARLVYPNTALVGMSIDARQFGTSIPSRSYEIYGRLIEVPSNYDPVTRAWDMQAWDGTWKRAWSDNPAWCIRDIALDKRYGLGHRMSPANVDKWTLAAIAAHCDEMIDDGDGGTRPRYTFNCCLRSQEAAYDVLTSFASAFRGWAYWSSGAMVCEQDRPEDPSLLIAPGNVADGKFSYSRMTPRDKRRSVVVMYYNDPDDGYRLSPVIVERPDLIERFGWEPGEELTAFGCTSEKEARTKALFVFEDEDSGNTAVSYAVGDDHAFAAPARIAEIADPRYHGSPRGGRIKARTSTTITLDREITLDAGATYTLSVMRPDGSVQTRQITDPAGTYQTVNLSGGGWQNLAPIAGAVWTIKSDQAANREFRIRKIATDREPYKVEAISHDPNKYARVELGIDLPPVNYLSLPSGPLGVPAGLAIREFLIRDGDAASPAILFSWQSADDPRVIAYQAQYRRPNGGWEALSDGLDLSREIRNAEPGNWQFRVRSLDNLGRVTAWQVADGVIDAATNALPEVSALAISTDDEALTARLEWNKPADVRPLRYEILRGPDSNIANATSLGITDQRGHDIAAPGWYFVRTAFADERSASPPSIEASAATMPAPIYGNITGAPQSLADLDAPASQAIADAQTDIDDLFATYGSTASAAQSAADAAQSALDAADDAIATGNDAASASSSAALASSYASTYFPPTTIAADLFTGQAAGDPILVADAASFVAGGGESGEDIFLLDTQFESVASKHVVPVQEGDSVRITVNARAADVGALPNLTFAWYWLDAGYGAVANSFNSRQITRTRTDYTTTVIAPSGARYARIQARQHTAGAASVDIYEYRVENVSQEVAAASSASIASGSATAASLDAASAATSSTLAADFAATAIQPRAVSAATHFYNGGAFSPGGSPETRPDATIGTGDNALPIISISVVNEYAFTKNVIPVAAGEDIEINARLESRAGSGGGADGQMHISWLDASYNYVTGSWAPVVNASYSPTDYSAILTVPSDPGIRFARIGVKKNNANDVTLAIYELWGSEVSAREDAASSATIATTQAGIATAEAAAAQASSELTAKLAANFLIDIRLGEDGDADWVAVDADWTRFVESDGVTFRNIGDKNPSSGGATNSHYYNINDYAPGIAKQIAGRRIRVGIYAKQAATFPSVEFAAAFATASVGNSGWQVFTPTANFEWYWFEYDVPLNGGTIDTTNLSQYIGIWPNRQSGTGSNTGLTVNRVAIEPVATGVIDLEASVTINQGAIASIENTAAFYNIEVAASGSDPAVVSLYSGSGGSIVDIAAQRLIIRNPINGSLQTVAEFSGGTARLNDALIRNLAVAPTDVSQIFHEVQLKPIILLAQDGQAVQYQGGASYGQVPDRIEIDIAGASLPALAQGESYDIRATNITATGFNMRAKKLTAAGSATQTSAAGSSVGGTPNWQTNKPTASNARDDLYQFSGTANLNRTNTYIDYVDENDPSTYRRVSTYSGTVKIYGKVGSAWQLLATKTLTFQINDPAASGPSHPETKSFGFSVVIQSGANFGNGSNRFGIHSGTATVTAFSGVTYSTQTTSGESAVGGNFKVSVYPPSNS